MFLVVISGKGFPSCPPGPPPKLSQPCGEGLLLLPYGPAPEFSPSVGLLAHNGQRLHQLQPARANLDSQGSFRSLPSPGKLAGPTCPC
eukprot:4527116-Pyramimonas_sp.AAC.1